MNQTNKQDVVSELTQQGRDLVNKANERHIIVRKADGTKLADVSVTMFAIGIILALTMFQPFGTLLIGVGVVYGIVNKLKVEVVHELTGNDEMIEINTDNLE